MPPKPKSKGKSKSNDKHTNKDTDKGRKEKGDAGDEKKESGVGEIHINPQKTIKKPPRNTIKITSRTYYVDKPNSRGFKINDQRFFISSDEYPFSDFDNVDYLLGEVVNYSEFAGNYKNINQNEDAKLNTNSFFESDSKDWYIIPVKFNEKPQPKDPLNNIPVKI
jgi:hypothetical protein